MADRQGAQRVNKGDGPQVSAPTRIVDADSRFVQRPGGVEVELYTRIHRTEQVRRIPLAVGWGR